MYVALLLENEKGEGKMENFEIGDPVVWFLWCGIALHGRSVAFEPFIAQSMLLISSRNLISLRIGHLYPDCFLSFLFFFIGEFCGYFVSWVFHIFWLMRI